MYKPIEKLQHSFPDFNQLMGLHMNPDNRWVRLAERIPWDIDRNRDNTTCLDINHKEGKIIKKMAVSKQTIFLIILAVVFSPAVIGIRYCLFKMGKLEDKKFKIMIESIGFVLFALYFRSLKDLVAYMLIFVMFISYITYCYYMLSLERSNDQRE